MKLNHVNLAILHFATTQHNLGETIKFSKLRHLLEQHHIRCYKSNRAMARAVSSAYRKLRRANRHHDAFIIKECVRNKWNKKAYL